MHITFVNYQLSIINCQLKRLLPICLIFFKETLVHLTYTSLVKQ
ncbi:hypothetical protein HMPREF9078_02382 [Capnocytophaga sp. oral taxon 380 str. F0488]|nr:hypothetical protein HMPREF9078_02382 [Capnocytophaga sp. oral taxon 380 str. F0488]